MKNIKNIKKSFIGGIRSVDSEKFMVEAVMSDETKDRYDEVIKASAWKKHLNTFKKHAVLLSSHSYGGLRNQIGVWEKVWVEENALVGRAKYFVGEGNPEADWAFKLVEKGIAAFSVGFIAHEYETIPWEEWEKNKKQPRRVFTEVELLETSQVLIPANPSALQRAAGEGGFYEKSIAEQIQSTFADDELLDEDKAIDINTKFFVKGHEDLFEDCVKEEEKADILEEKATPEVILDDDLENRSWEETENEIRCRLKDPDKYDKFRHYTIKKDKPRVYGIYGKIKGKDEWETQALRFPKSDGWTTDSAKEWVKSHPDIKLVEGDDYEDIQEEPSIDATKVSNEDKTQAGSEGSEDKFITDDLKKKIREAIQDEIRICIEELVSSQMKSSVEQILTEIASVKDLITGTLPPEISTSEEAETTITINNLVEALGSDNYVSTVLSDNKKLEDKAVRDLLNAVNGLTQKVT